MFPERLDDNRFPSSGSAQPKRTLLTAYNSSIIKQFGTVTILCKHDCALWQQEEFYVIDVDGPAILGLPACRRLHLVTLHCPIKALERPAYTPISDVAMLKGMYPDRFDGIGQFPEQLPITMKENVLLVVQPPRKYPI